MSRTEVITSVPDIETDGAPRETEQTPSDLILPPQPSGNYDVDESVRACEVCLSSIAQASLTNVSFSCLWNKHRTCAELWHVTVGQDRENHRQVAFRRGEELLP